MREIFRIICLAGAIQAFFLFIVLIARRNNRKANLYLSLIMIFGAIDLIELFLGAGGYIGPARPYQLSIIPYSFIFGPSMFLYIALLTARVSSFSKKYLMLYAPFITALGINITLHFAFNTSRLPGCVIYANIIINGGGLLFEAILYVMAFVILQRYTGRLKEYFSDIDSMKLSLFRVVLVVLILTVIFIFLPYTRENHMRQELGMFDIIAILGGLVLLFGIAFMAVLQPEIFNRVRLMENILPRDEPPPSPKYEKLRLPASQEEHYVKKLREHMTEEKPYLNEELTLHDLAGELSLPAHHLSMILNIHFKQNFYNFINSYRVEDVKQKLVHPGYKDQNILTIAYNAGFNSKSTFNTMFKKFTGKTPKEYRADFSM